MPKSRIAIIHDYLNQQGGAERVVGTLHRMFPEAPIYTSILDRSSLWPTLRDADIRTSWMQRLPGVRSHFKKYLPFFPHAIESFDLTSYDLVISSSSAFAKAAITRKDAVHLCYCHTPMRFVWDYDRYVEREQFGPLVKMLLPPMIKRLKAWDLATADRPTVYVANSTVVSDRIQRHYGRESVVLFPPVELERCRVSAEDGDFFLVLSRLNGYKRVDLVIEAFNKLGLPLVIIGDGPVRPALERMAKPNIRFLGRLPDVEVADYLARCLGLIFPGEEDFGITPLEANASGRPVIAFQAGGALDTTSDGETGVFFGEQNVPSLIQAVQRCRTIQWDKQLLIRNAKRFSEAVFRTGFEELINQALERRALQPIG